MKAFIFDPLWPKLADDILEKQLAESGVEVVVITNVKPLFETKGYYSTPKQHHFFTS